MGLPWKAGHLSSQDFALQPDGTLRYPADQKLILHEHRREADGSLRIVYGASLRSCRPFPVREHCQWQGSATKKARRVSVLLHPLAVGLAPLLWHDWSRRRHRQACLHLLRSQRVDVQMKHSVSASPELAPVPLSRAQRARARLSWQARLLATDALQTQIR